MERIRVNTSRLPSRPLGLLAAGLLALGLAALPGAAEATPANPTTPVLVLDAGAGIVYEIDTDNVQTVFASGLATSAYGGLAFGGLAHDAAGNVYATSGAHVVRFSNSGGNATTVLTATSGEFTDVAVDGHDNLYALNDATQQITELTPSGTQSTFATDGYYSLTVDAAGTVYSADNSNIYAYPASGRTQSVFLARGADTLDVASDGTLWAVGGFNLQSFDTAGVVTSSAPLPGEPLGIGADSAGNVFLALFDST